MSQLVAWYDGECSLCRREISLMRRLDRRGKIEFVDITAGSARDCPKNRTALMARFHVEKDGRLLAGAAAFAAMWRAIPLLRPLGLVARIPMMLALLERLYGCFLVFRPNLQRVARRLESR